MESAESTTATASDINYDESPITQLELEGIEYRVDAGRGPAVAVSHREAGTWAWLPLAEGRFDGVRLKVKALSHPVVSALSTALMRAMKDSAEA